MPTNIDLSWRAMAFAFAIACSVGCRTADRPHAQRLHEVVAKVLAEHHFTPPTIVIDASFNNAVQASWNIKLVQNGYCIATHLREISASDVL
jgi:hypothetical protein